jgi:hypothetical protein
LRERELGALAVRWALLRISAHRGRRFSGIVDDVGGAQVIV